MKKYRAVAAIIVSQGNKYLLVRKPRKDNAWQFPQGGVDEGESLIQAAQRELQEECGQDLRVTISSQSIGEYEYLFPESFTRHFGEYDGAHVVFFQAEWIDGAVEIDNNEIVESRWCRREGIKNLVEKKYWEVVKKFL